MAISAATRRERKWFLLEFDRCWVCGSTEQPCVHEIARGVHRKDGVKDRAAWIRACYPCNGGPLNRYDVWPLARQYALKLVNDREHYDRIALNRMRSRADEAITDNEVLAWITAEGDVK